MVHDSNVALPTIEMFKNTFMPWNQYRGEIQVWSVIYHPYDILKNWKKWVPTLEDQKIFTSVVALNIRHFNYDFDQD